MEQLLDSPFSGHFLRPLVPDRIFCFGGSSYVFLVGGHTKALVHFILLMQLGNSKACLSWENIHLYQCPHFIFESKNKWHWPPDPPFRVSTIHFGHFIETFLFWVSLWMDVTLQVKIVLRKNDVHFCWFVVAVRCSRVASLRHKGWSPLCRPFRTEFSLQVNHTTLMEKKITTPNSLMLEVYFGARRKKRYRYKD